MYQFILLDKIGVQESDLPSVLKQQQQQKLTKCRKHFVRHYISSNKGKWSESENIKKITKIAPFTALSDAPGPKTGRVNPEKSQHSHWVGENPWKLK